LKNNFEKETSIEHIFFFGQKKKKYGVLVSMKNLIA